jgi:hypothetical protein
MTLVYVTRTLQIEGVFSVRYMSVSNVDTTQSYGFIQSLLFFQIVVGVHVFMLDSVCVGISYNF